ncbi:MAG: ArsC family reductase [Parahaliea sp.]
MITLYGIPNCDTVKKARKWLDQHCVDYQFHDMRNQGIHSEQVKAWLDELGWEVLINRRSTSWQALTANVRESMDKQQALAAIMEQPTLIKRPLLDTGHERICGFSSDRYADLLNRHTL